MCCAKMQLFHRYLVQGSGRHSIAVLAGGGNTHIDTFLRLIEETSDDEGRAKISLYIKLKEAYNRGNKVTRNPNGIFYYEGEELGPDLKAAASNIAKTKELRAVKDALLLGDED